MLQLLLRLGTFQLSDIFYNTVGGVAGGLVYLFQMKMHGWSNISMNRVLPVQGLEKSVKS